jgi:putative transposase
MPKRNRQSHRMRGYDYTRQSAYFVTIVTVLRQHIFGTVVNGEMRLNAWGQVAAAEWDQTAVVRPNVDVPAFVVMPNHVHAVVVIHEPTTNANPTDDADHITNTNRRGLACQTPTAPKPAYGQPVAGSLGTIVGAYKENTDVPLHVPTPP